MSTVPLPLARRRIDRWLRSSDGLAGVMRETLEFADTRIGARAVSDYMRDGKASGEVAQATRLRFTKDGRIRRGGKRYSHVTRRAKGDTGPLRILSGTLAKAVRGKGPASVARIEMQGSLSMVLRKGVDAEQVPYAAVHEYGGSFSQVKARRTIHIPARPYLRPAARDEMPVIKKRAEQLFKRSLVAAIRSGVAT